MYRAMWLCAPAALLVACQSHETPQQAQARMQKETEAFTAVAAPTAKRYASWAAAGQADSIASIFTEQGREMPPNEPAVVGRAAIKVYEARNAATMAAKLTIRGESYMASGPLGIERGSYHFDGTAKPGAPKGIPASVSDDGKYLIHWHNVNGQWLMADMIWNSNHSMMPTGMAGKKKASHTAAKPAPTKAKAKKKKK
jgi:ketosteroid isomerase-like protein